LGWCVGFMLMWEFLVILVEKYGSWPNNTLDF
jgi:hypothetical protein